MWLLISAVRSIWHLDLLTLETHDYCIESGTDYRSHCESASKTLAATLQQILAASAAMWVVIRAARSIWLAELSILLTTYSFCKAHMTILVKPKKFKLNMIHCNLKLLASLQNFRKYPYIFNCQIAI